MTQLGMILEKLKNGDVEGKFNEAKLPPITVDYLLSLEGKETGISRYEIETTIYNMMEDIAYNILADVEEIIGFRKESNITPFEMKTSGYGAPDSSRKIGSDYLRFDMKSGTFTLDFGKMLFDIYKGYRSTDTYRVKKEYPSYLHRYIDKWERKVEDGMKKYFSKGPYTQCCELSTPVNSFKVVDNSNGLGLLNLTVKGKVIDFSKNVKYTGFDRDYNVLLKKAGVI